MDTSRFSNHIHSWLVSEQAESPVLLTGPPETQWEHVMQDIQYMAACVSKTNTPCRACPACKQVAAGTHTDSIVVEGEEKVIRVAHIRDLLETLSRTSFSKRRLIIIPRAERLRLEAANTLLKELEESSSANRFLLTTPFPKRLLATIRSRCQLVRVPASFVPAAKAHQEDPVQTIQTIARLDRKQPLTDEELHTLNRSLQTLLVSSGPTPAVYRCLLRLRDYYKIKGERGNEKLATDVLLASLSQIRHNSK
jgi:DNA polymerase III delta prime subunit